jgi:hypothetical protein
MRLETRDEEQNAAFSSAVSVKQEQPVSDD